MEKPDLWPGRGADPRTPIYCRGPRKNSAIPLLTLKAFVAYKKDETYLNPDLVSSTKFKSLNQIQKIKKNNCRILEFIISPKSSYCHYSPPQAPKPQLRLCCLQHQAIDKSRSTVSLGPYTVFRALGVDICLHIRRHQGLSFVTVKTFTTWSPAS